MPDPSQVKITEERVKAQAGKNLDNVMRRLLETKQQLQSETDNGEENYEGDMKRN
jgi:hypothetical protein